MKYGLLFGCLLVCLVSSCSRKYEYSRSAPPAVTNQKPSSKGIQQRVHHISKLKLPYVFGGSTPSDGGMDCSGSIQYLLKQSGFRNVPRTSYAQYEWVKDNSRIKRGKEIQANKLKFGDLIFWGGTYDSGHKVSHVMLYLGEQPDGKLHMYGARGKKVRGLNGAGVDVHELRRGTHKNLIGYGSIPGF